MTYLNDLLNGQELALVMAIVMMTAVCLNEIEGLVELVYLVFQRFLFDATAFQSPVQPHAHVSLMTILFVLLNQMLMRSAL